MEIGLFAESAGLPDLGQTLARRVVVALKDIAHDGVASIEHEDPYVPGFAGVERTVALLREVL